MTNASSTESCAAISPCLSSFVSSLFVFDIFALFLLGLSVLVLSVFCEYLYVGYTLLMMS